MVLRCDHLDDGVAVLTLDRPEARNALSPELRQALRDSLDRLAGEPSVRALVLTGAGESFCAGGDIKTMGERDPEANKARMEQVASCALALARFPRPVVAAVAGHAAGAGVSLACLCDIILAEESARFAFLFLNVGLGPDWGLSHTLPRRVGSAAARRLLLTRASLPAPEAAALGLVDRICAPGQMLDEARALAAQLAAGPPEAT
ncbi:MAG: enoyl-CoA hydratase/isomerase family protein, partial [Pseudomonadota bacterium]